MKDLTGQIFGGDWTEQKLEILRKYLESYNTALKKQPFKRIYIDAFAGTGYRRQQSSKYDNFALFDELKKDESEKFLKGSAKLALEINPSFDKYIFIETDEEKISELEKLRIRHPDKIIEIIQRDANEFIQNYCYRENWTTNRAVLFLDPFATEVEWPTIESIAKTQSIDVWILFPLMAVNRLLARDPQKAFSERLNRIFGTDEWFERFYNTQTLNDIFGKSEEVIFKACSFKGIEQFYKERLINIFSGVAEKTRVFYNSRQSPLFQLFFAAGNPKGAPIAIRIADHLLKNI
jgi:three-Cys-motif partner protein